MIVAFRDKELAAVKVSKEDIQVIANEMGFTLQESEVRLRENGGDLEKTLRCILNVGLPEDFLSQTYL